MKKHSLKAIIIACLLAFSVMAFTACAEEKKPPEPADEYGTVTIADKKLYVDTYSNVTFAKIDPVFSKPDKKEELTYTCSDSEAKYLEIANGIVKPTKRGDRNLTVTAKSDHFETTFKVEIEYINYDADDVSELYNMSSGISSNVPLRATVCKAVKPETTLFVGDSFMDSAFIGEYMKTYSKDKEVLNAGISSTTSYHWEKTYKEIIGETAPKNIVIHVGTNNFYDSHDTVEDTEASLMRLFMYMHNSYPTSKIYWFNITQREDSTYANQVKETNAYIAKCSEDLDFLTVVDTSSKVTTAMLRDGVHPTDNNYKVFTDALVDEAHCEIVEKKK